MVETISKKQYQERFPIHLPMRYGTFANTMLPDVQVVVTGLEGYLCALGFASPDGMSIEAVKSNLHAQFASFDRKRDWQRDDDWAEGWNLPYTQMREDEILALPMLLVGTPFQQKVWQEMLRLGLQEHTTYGELAQMLGKPLSHARAIGGAVGRNPISWLVPCHRVLAHDNSLNGYRWGLSVKVHLLAIEESFFGR